MVRGFGTLMNFCVHLTMHFSSFSSRFFDRKDEVQFEKHLKKGEGNRRG